MPKIVAVMPIKLNNERLPGKNTKILGDKPLLRYELDTLLKIKELESINVAALLKTIEQNNNI